MKRSLGYWVRELVIVGVIAAAVIGAVHWLGVGGPHSVLEAGGEAPTFTLAEVVTGDEVDLAALRGRPVILAFWATYCGPCVKELPDLERLHREAEGRYAVITISGEPPRVLREFIGSRGYGFPVLSDGTRRVHSAYRVDMIPMTVIIDGEGTIVRDFVGPARATVLAEQVARLL